MADTLNDQLLQTFAPHAELAHEKLALEAMSGTLNLDQE